MLVLSFNQYSINPLAFKISVTRGFFNPNLNGIYCKGLKFGYLIVNNNYIYTVSEFSGSLLSNI